MRAWPRPLALAGGVALLAATGCRSYAPTYAPYSPPIYSAPAYPAPGTMLGPSSPTPVAPGTVIGPPGSYPADGGFPSGSPYPTPADSWPSGASGGDAPPFTGDPTRSGASQPRDPGLVPNYDDPNSLPSFDSSRVPDDDPFTSGQSPFEPDFKSDGASSQRRDAADPAGPEFAAGSTSGSVPVRSASSTRTVGTHTAKAPQPDPFDHDPTGSYRWLRGVIDRNPNNGTWHVRYARDPDPSDLGQGEVQLTGLAVPRESATIPVGRNEVRPGDVVLVEGRLILKGPDGKAEYEVDQLIGPLVPKTQ